MVRNDAAVPSCVPPSQAEQSGLSGSWDCTSMAPLLTLRLSCGEQGSDIPASVHVLGNGYTHEARHRPGHRVRAEPEATGLMPIDQISGRDITVP